MLWSNLLLPGLLLLPAYPAAPPADPGEALLREAGIATDPAGLAAFFRARTLTPEARREIEGQVGRLGADEFAAREAATEALIARGVVALPFLRRAAEAPDLEVRRRIARCLKAITAGPGSALPATGSRLLARRAPERAVEVLLAYLPYADDAEIESAVLDALLLATPPGARPDPLLLAALSDPLPILREAGSHVVGRRGNRDQVALVRRRLTDPEPRVRLRAAETLLAAHDRDAVPPLIELVGAESVRWRAEDLLFRLAGENPPTGVVAADTPEARRRSLDAWRAWWKSEGAKVDLARLDDGARQLGLTLCVEYNKGRVWECGRDGKVRWEIRGLQGPMEAAVLPGGRVLIAEGNNNLLSERDLAGKVLWKKELGAFSPTGVQRLPNGNTFVSAHAAVMELDRDGKEVYRYPLPGGGSNGIWRARNGLVLSVVGSVLQETDRGGKVVRKIPLPAPGPYIGVKDLPGDRFLVCNSGNGKVYEVDATGKPVWETSLVGACGIARLPGGNTLVSTNELVVEFDRAGQRVWQAKAEGYVRRVHRR